MTVLWQRLRAHGDDLATRALGLLELIEHLRILPQRDLDGAILLLASQASRYMTGSVITVDGGFLLA